MKILYGIVLLDLIAYVQMLVHLIFSENIK